MIVIPAIDLMDGKVVRLKKGKKSDFKVYSTSPADMARQFEQLGARRIHVVDLDSAFGSGNNRKVIRQIAEAVAIPIIEVGGGIRTKEDIEEILCCKAEKVIIGTMPVKNPKLFEEVVSEFGKSIIVGVDVEDGFVRVSGWVENTKIDYISFLSKMQSMGIEETIVTDISKDGMLSGIDLDFYKDIAYKTGLKVIASGGVKDENDIEKLAFIEQYGVIGVVVGKAIYEKTIDLKKILEKYR
jgi:phosphoribosylformimino-5-aminoimidazole carboxamide ribotide isomerase